ncbi:MAG: SCO family protein [Rhodothermales bacterium]
MVCLFLSSVWQAEPVTAQRTGQTPEVFEGVGIDERLGDYVPMDLIFQDEHGQEVELGTYFDGEKPVLLNFVYHDCPMLCNLWLDQFTIALRAMTWVPGDEFEVLTVSFNALETPELAARQKARYLRALGKPEAGAGWHFLTGDEAAIDQLTQAVGFGFRWIEEQQEFAHPTALIFLSGEGKITRYLPGIEFVPRDVRLSLVEASEGTVGTTMDRIFLTCFRYDSEANSYVLHAINIMKIAGLFTVLVLSMVLFVFWRRESRRSKGLSGYPNLEGLRNS